MSSPTKCSRCGSENPPQAKYCSRCGSAIAIERPPPNSPLQIPFYPGSFSPKPIDEALSRLEPRKRDSINRTRSGLILIFFGIILAPIPSIATYAGGATFAGAILVFLGRQGLSEIHRRYATWSFAIIILGIIAELAAGFSVGVFLAISSINGGDPATTLSSAFLTLNILLTITGAIIGLGLVLLTYDLQNATGRTLLWSAFSLGVLIDGIITLIIAMQVQADSSQILSQVGTVGDALVALQQMFLPLRLLQWIPAIPYGIAYRRAWLSVDKQVVTETLVRL